MQISGRLTLYHSLPEKNIIRFNIFLKDCSYEIQRIHIQIKKCTLNSKTQDSSFKLPD